MIRDLVAEELRERRRSLAWWSLGVTGFILLNVLFYPSIKDSSELSDYSKDLPEAMRALFVGGELDLTSPVGFLNSQIFALLAPMLLAVFAIGFGAAAIAGQEERGLLDLVLAQPVKRSAFALAQFGALAAATLIVTVVLFASVVGGSAAVGLEISTGNVVAACVSTMLLSLLFGTLALAAGGAASGKGRAIAFAAALALFSWIIDGLAATVRWLEPFQAISPYHLAFGDGPLANGAPWADWAWLALMIAATLGVSVAGLRRRDIG